MMMRSICRFWLLGCVLAALGAGVSAGCGPPDSGPHAGSKAVADAAARPTDSSVKPGPDWPLFRGDHLASGVARGTLPEKLGVVWTFSVEDGGFESTASIVGDMVYIGSTDGNLYALDLDDGERKWAFHTELGFSASAAVRDGSVYIGDVDGRFYCLDAGSGRQRWHFDSGAEIDSSANFYAEGVLFGSQDGFLYCLATKDGKLVWKYESEDQIRCFPTVVENRGFVAGCDGRLHVIDLDHGREEAHVELDAPTGSAPAVLGDMLFVGTEGSALFAIDWRAAKVVWTYRGRKRNMPFRSSAAVTPRIVVVGSLDKSVHAVDPKTGRPRWTFATKGRVETSPVIVGRRVFVGSADGRLYALDRQTGRELWRFEAGGSLLASPAVAGGRLVIGTDDGTLYCFGSAADGR